MQSSWEDGACQPDSEEMISQTRACEFVWFPDLLAIQKALERDNQKIVVPVETGPTVPVATALVSHMTGMLCHTPARCR